MKKKDIIPLTDEENKFYEEQKVCNICKKEDLVLIMTKSIINSEIIVITQENLKELLIVFTF